MLTITIPSREVYNPETQEFYYTEAKTIALEHSLVSISKWESKWHKPYLKENNKSPKELMDYVRCMTITQNVSEDVYAGLTKKNVEEINSYLEDSQTATTFSDNQKRGFSREVVTSELIYYWMFQFGIPKECEKWPLTRLLTLIRIFSIKSQPSKKMSTSEILSRNKTLNDARRAMYHTKG